MVEAVERGGDNVNEYLNEMATFAKSILSGESLSLLIFMALMLVCVTMLYLLLRVAVKTTQTCSAYARTVTKQRLPTKAQQLVAKLEAQHTIYCFEVDRARYQTWLVAHTREQARGAI